jgi:hypothetical protein
MLEKTLYNKERTEQADISNRAGGGEGRFNRSAEPVVGTLFCTVISR